MQVGHLVGHVVRRDEFVFGVHGQLRVVTHHSSVRRGHFPRVRVGHRNLLLFCVQLRQQFLVPVLPLLQRRDLGDQFLFRERRPARFGRVRPVQFLQILRQPRIGPVNQFLKFEGVEILVTRIDRRELAPVYGQQLSAEEFQLAAQQRELPRHGLERFEVVLAKVGDGLEVRRRVCPSTKSLPRCAGTPLPITGTNAPGADNRRGKV